jgi:hypothetical protein
MVGLHTSNRCCLIARDLLRVLDQVVSGGDLLRELDQVVSGGGLLLATCEHKTWPLKGAEPELRCLHVPCVMSQPAINEMPGPVAHCWLHEFRSTLWFPCPRDDPCFKSAWALSEQKMTKVMMILCRAGL